MLDGLLLIAAWNMIFDQGTLVEGSILLLGNQIKVVSSTLSASYSGCADNSMKGTPSASVSHSFKCGLSGGTYGGRGGIGIS
jgi:hypothetical protein